MAVASVEVQENWLCLAPVASKSFFWAGKTMTNVLVGLGVMFY